MAISKEDILEAVANMTVMEISELISAMEEKFGVTAAVPVAAVAGGAGEAAEEQTEFDVILKDGGANKINVIKVVRAVTGLALKEAKDLVEAGGKAVKEGISKEDAAKLKKELEEAGATVEVK